MSRWKPGQSGNPAGRAPGSGELGKLRAAIDPHVPQILEKLAEAAKAGDTQAARLLLERALPAYKAVDPSVELELSSDAPLADQAKQVLAAISSGSLPPYQASIIVNALAGIAKILETDDLQKRIEKLEERISRQLA